MQHEQAVQLITHPALKSPAPSTWADLGAGSGVFTRALAVQLSAGSTIYALDLSPQAIAPVPGTEVIIQTLQGDLGATDWSLPPLDGILMANSLHYIADQAALIQRLGAITSRFLVVEYDTHRGNQWVPYPVAYDRLLKLFKDYTVTRLGMRPSLFGGAPLYSCYITR